MPTRMPDPRLFRPFSLADAQTNALNIAQGQAGLQDIQAFQQAAQSRYGGLSQMYQKQMEEEEISNFFDRFKLISAINPKSAVDWAKKNPIAKKIGIHDLEYIKGDDEWDIVSGSLGAWKINKTTGQVTPLAKKEDKPAYDMQTLYGPKGQTRRVSIPKGSNYTPPEGWTLDKPGTAGGADSTSLIKNINFLVNNGIAKNKTEAYKLARESTTMTREQFLLQSRLNMERAFPPVPEDEIPVRLEKAAQWYDDTFSGESKSPEQSAQPSGQLKQVGYTPEGQPVYEDAQGKRWLK